MADLETVLKDVQREVKAFGTDVKALKDSMQKDLDAVRKIAEDTPKSVVASAEFKKDMDALTAGVLEKHDALAKQVKAIEETALKAAQERIDQLEKKFNRGRLGGSGEGDEEFKQAADFTRTAMALRGELKVGVPFNEERVDVAAVKAYREALLMYLRRDKDGVDTKAMSIGSDPDGGYMVMPTIGRIMTGVQFETSPMRDIADIVTISSDAIEYPRDDDEASGGWVGEQEDRTETNTPKVGMQRIPVHELYAQPKLMQKLLEDAGSTSRLGSAASSATSSAAWRQLRSSPATASRSRAAL
jgi:HK97 family phage major capsid protein